MQSIEPPFLSLAAAPATPRPQIADSSRARPPGRTQRPPRPRQRASSMAEAAADASLAGGSGPIAPGSGDGGGDRAAAHGAVAAGPSASESESGSDGYQPPVPTREEELSDALFDACCDGCVDRVRAALDAGASVGGEPGQWTPLHAACEYDWCEPNQDIIKLLLSRGAQLEARDSKGRTPLLVAVQVPGLCTDDSVLALLEAGANIAARDNDGRTVMHCAGLGDEDEYLYYDEDDAYGKAGSQLAIMRRLPAVFMVLMDHGADMGALDARGFTPMEAAVADARAGALAALVVSGLAPLPANGVSAVVAKDLARMARYADSDRICEEKATDELHREAAVLRAGKAALEAELASVGRRLTSVAAGAALEVRRLAEGGWAGTRGAQASVSSCSVNMRGGRGCACGRPAARCAAVCPLGMLRKRARAAGTKAAAGPPSKVARRG